MKASMFLKHLFSAIVAAVKGRSAATRTKTSAVRTRLVIFSILRNKKLLMSAINTKIQAIMGGRSQDGNHPVEAASGPSSGGGRKTAAVLQNLPSFVLLNSLPSFAMGRDGGGGSDSPLVMVRSEEEREKGMAKQLQQLANAPPGSVVDLARGAAEQGGVELRLEDEIDHVADVFIRRFHDQMKLQKLESFKRFCEMLERN
ncbi:unnamed protein product [Alopecurus aequalis]